MTGTLKKAIKRQGAKTMTCKDCIYEPRCYSIISYGMDTDDLTGELLTDIENRCKDFKNKADVVPVVRCKDCKYRGCIDDIDYVCERVEPRFVSKDHFCGYGERKDNNG